MLFKLINQFKVGPSLTRLKTHTRYTSGVQKERRLLGCGVYIVIILELCKWKKSDPVILSLIDKESELLLQFLVDPFHLPITLGVVGSGCC